MLKKFSLSLCVIIVAGGMNMIFFKPFEVGDRIKTNDIVGKKQLLITLYFAFDHLLLICLTDSLV